MLELQLHSTTSGVPTCFSGAEFPLWGLCGKCLHLLSRPSYWLLIYRSYGWRQCSNQDIVFPWHQESIVFKMYYYLFIFNYVCMYIWMQVPTRPEMSDPLVAELQVVVSYPWVWNSSPLQELYAHLTRSCFSCPQGAHLINKLLVGWKQQEEVRKEVSRFCG